MTTFIRPKREEQALREVGRTEVSRSVAAAATSLFSATVVVVGLFQGVIDLRAQTEAPWARVRSLTARTAGIVLRSGETGFFAANRGIRNAIEDFEDRLEDESFLRSRLLPQTQITLSSLFGLGNEQAYLGLKGWLYFRADFDHVTGPGFLGDRTVADPIPAILALQHDLEARGIELVVLPTPVKPTIHPEFLVHRALGTPVHNASFADFVAQLESERISVFDPTPLLAVSKSTTGAAQYLRGDTHWTPQAMEAVASAMASYLDQRIDWREPRSSNLVRRRISVAGRGDVFEMLRLPADQGLFRSEQVEVARVLTQQGQPWRPSVKAEVLVLGDSFTNVYSDASLGWGSGAGLAEQLAFGLGRPVDRIAANAGGALGSRQALVRGLAASTNAKDRLTPKRVVIYQFAARELSQGDWRVLELPSGSLAAEIDSSLDP